MKRSRDEFLICGGGLREVDGKARAELPGGGAERVDAQRAGGQGRGALHARAHGIVRIVHEQRIAAGVHDRVLENVCRARR